MIAKTATFQVRADAVEPSVVALEAFVRAVGENEPDTLFYTVFQDAGDPTRFTNFFAFTDREAEEHHRGTPWVKAFTDVLYPNTLEGVVFTEYRVIATTTGGRAREGRMG